MNENGIIFEFQLLHMQPARRGRRARCLQLNFTPLSVDYRYTTNHQSLGRF